MGNLDLKRSLCSIFKMNRTVLLPLLLTFIALSKPASSDEPRVVCYYTNWSVYRPGTARFNPQNINPYLCTHLIYAFGGFTKDNTLKPFDKYQDIEKGGYAKFTGLKTYNKELKTLLAIGGWNEGSSRFSPMVGSRERRKEFVRNCIKFLRQNRFDGLDLDWEYPAFRDGGKPKDRENYAKLVKELREEFEREADKTRKPRLLLTMAVPAGIEYIEKGFDVQTLNQYLDWMNLLSYDYHSAFEPAVNHHAPLYPLEEPNEYSVDTELNIDYTIKFYLENGVDSNKLVLGIPTYGRSYTLFNEDAVEIGSPADGPGEQGDATREKGYLAYYEICEALKPKSKKRNSDSDEDSEEYSEEVEDEWTVMHPNPQAMGPVAFKGNQWVGYDDVDIVKKKAQYVAENGLGGIMFWSIDNDDFRGTCHGKPYPLIEAAKEAYINRLATTERSVVREKPKSVTSRPGGRRKNRPKTTKSTTTTTTTTTTTPKPTTTKSNARKNSLTSTTPAWNIITPEPPTTPDPGSDFKCVDEGFYPHPRDCKKYFWCLDSGPSDLGIVAHQFTCPSGLFFNKAADSCDFARNVACKASTPKPTTKAPTTRTTLTTTPSTTTTTTRKPLRISTRNSVLFRTTTSTTSTTPEPESEEEYDEVSQDANEDAEDPKVIKELIDLIKKVGGIEQLEKQLHLSETSASTDGGITTTPSSFNKKLYQKVLERARGKNKFGGNSIFENSVQNSRRAPQNQGLEPAVDKDKLLKKDRPQYTTINRKRPTTTVINEAEESEEFEDESEEEDQDEPNSAPVETELSVATTAKALQYVNIRRARPTSDTADETASNNALFERRNPIVTKSESLNSLDILSARRENVPEYVTIRRQRPSTEETTTIQYQKTEPEEEEEQIALEKEISSQPQYTSIVRTRSTTLSPFEEPSSPVPTVSRIRSTTIPTIEESSSPGPTTVLAVQISSLLNSLSFSDTDRPISETTGSQTTNGPELTTITSPSATSQLVPRSTSTSTIAPSSVPTRRTILRRRGSSSTTTSTAASSPSSTQVSSRNFAFRRRRPLASSNEIFSDSDNSEVVSRKIRSTTPDSLEVDRLTGNNYSVNKLRGTFQSSPNEDSIPAAASITARGDFRPEVNTDEEQSFIFDNNTPESEIDFSSYSDINQRQRTTAAIAAIDSEASAATVDLKRANVLPRGKNRFTLNLTTEPIPQAQASRPVGQRRPTFARFSPRPFARTTDSPDIDGANLNNNEQRSVTQRNILRLPFGRSRSTATAIKPVIQARKLPFPSRFSTQKPTSTINEEEEIENKNDDILLSESAIEEKEHKENYQEVEETTMSLKTIGTTIPYNTNAYNSNLDDSNGRRRIKIIRKRPSSTTTTVDVEEFNEPITTMIPRIRKIIRKKVKSVDELPDVVAKSIGSFDSLKETTTETILNYGERTKETSSYSSFFTPTSTTTEVVVETSTDVTDAFYADSKFTVNATENSLNINNLFETATGLQEDTQSITEATVDSNEKVTKQTEVVTEFSKDSDERPNNENHEIKSYQKDFSRIDIKNETLIEDTTPAITNSEISINIDNETVPLNVVETNVTTPIDIPITETSETKIDTTTTSTTQLTSPSVRTRGPYRPSKKVFTSTTASSIPSSSRYFSRKYNPGAYTSPKTVERESVKPDVALPRRPFPSKIFTRKPFSTTKTTPRIEYEEDEYYDDEELLEEEPENPFVFVPQNQYFTKKPDYVDESEDDTLNEEPEELLEEEEEVYDEEIPETRITSTTRNAPFKPRIINANTPRSPKSTTELPRSFGNSIANSLNKTGGFPRFISNKPVNGTKNRVQNVPTGYNIPVSAIRPKTTLVNNNKTHTPSTDRIAVSFTTQSRSIEPETATIVEDNTISNTEAIKIVEGNLQPNDITTVSMLEIETTTVLVHVDTNKDDYLVNTEDTTHVPTIADNTGLQTLAVPESSEAPTTTDSAKTTDNAEITTKQIPITTPITTTPATTTTSTTTTPVPPIIKTQFDKLFAVSRVVEVSSKLDKHRLNKNNETTLIEEGPIKIERKPVVDKIGEVSRFSLIKIVEDDIPIYLTKFGHIYPVENPPDNPIRIDEARNARALSYLDIPKENLVTSESINEAYRHVKRTSEGNGIIKSAIQHLPRDGFLSYINDDKKDNAVQDDPLFAQWQFVPAAYENEKAKQARAAKQLEIITPRSMLTNPSTLPLEGLFRTEKPNTARKVSDTNQPFVVYSATATGNLEIKKEKATNVALNILKPEPSHSVITSVKGQELRGAPVTEEVTIKYPVNVTVLSSTLPPTTTILTSTISTTQTSSTSPIIALLSTKSTNKSTTLSPETTTASASPAITETNTKQIAATKVSTLDAKRAKFSFPRRPLIKSSNFTRTTSAPRSITKKTNATVPTNSIKKVNKTSSFNSTKSRLTANRVQNVPVDIKKKIGNIKSTTRSYTTETPRSTTERRLYFKSLRPGFQRPAFVPRRNTLSANNADT